LAKAKSFKKVKTTLTCPSCQFSIEVKGEMTTQVDCPMCNTSKMSVKRADIRLPTEQEVIVPDMMRPIDWSFLNLEKEFPIASRSLFASTIASMIESGGTDTTLRLAESSMLAIINTLPVLDKKVFTPLVQGYLNAIIHNLLHISRGIRSKSKPRKKLNHNVEKAYLFYSGLPMKEIKKLKNKNWDNYDK